MYNIYILYGVGINSRCTGFWQAAEFVFTDLEFAPDKEAVTVMVDFEPIRLETMIKFKDQTKV